MPNIGRTALGLAALAALAGGAYAKPPFAEKEGVKCTYCHAPNPPTRNYRGAFYKANGLSFAGFDDAAEAKKAGAEIGADADAKPKSWTPPKTAAEPKPEANAAPKGASVADLAKACAAAEAAYKKKPKDAKCKAAYADALAALGHGQMLDTSVPPVKRYPGALKTLRAALKVNPAQPSAKADVKAIEDAYTSMGKPIPK